MMGIKETLHKVIHHEEFDHKPQLEELKDVPPIGGEEYPSWHPIPEMKNWMEELDPDNYTTIYDETTDTTYKPLELQRPVDLTPYEANRVRHWEQRRRARRITGDGRKRI